MASAHIRDRYEQMEAEIAANNEQGSNEDESQSEQPAEQAQAPESQEAGPEHAYEQDQQVQYVDADGVAHNGTVLEFDPNGYYIVQFDNPPTGKKLIDSYTEAELDAMTGRESSSSEAAAEAPSTENASSPIVEDGMDIFDMPEAAPSSPAPATDTTNKPSTKPSAPAAPQQRAIDRIPVDEKGNHVFENAPVEDTAAALIEQMGGSVDEAIDNAQTAIRQLTEEAKKASARVEGIRSGKVKASMDEMIEAKNKAKAIAGNVKYWENVLKYLEGVKNGAEARAEAEAQAEENAPVEDDAPVNDENEYQRHLQQRREKIKSEMGDKYSLSDEVADNGELFVQNENGSTILR